ncbi:MAG: hypothetical protein GF315_05790, partial [candidate division Zixibacteria bacterium]|nr:hypothetical protein [candidate division Zixibacteria bacterium]
MRRVVTLTVVCVVLYFVSANATVINIPDDYPTIQQGIDASFDGDTVLVQPGTYFENIDFNGHNITVCSKYLLTGDTSYISATIIDGDSLDTVVRFANGEDSTTALTGFTIQNGFSLEHGGGIFCFNCRPQISYNLIKNNHSTMHGGGIYVEVGRLFQMIKANRIKYNSSGGNGGGIHLYNCDTIVDSNTVSFNTAGDKGGGIYVIEGAPIINNNLISRNLAYTAGGGLEIASVIHTVLLNSNTINGNHTNNHGDGCQIRFNSCNTNITNSIIWNDTDSNCVDIDIYGFNNIVVNYSDVIGGWSGEGEHNIDTSPFFIDPENEGYNLSADSPCIDAGDPDFPIDPDGTISDIGAYYYEQELFLIYDESDFELDIILQESVSRAFSIQSRTNAYALPLCDSGWVSFEPDSLVFEMGDTV